MDEVNKAEALARIKLLQEKLSKVEIPAVSEQDVQSKQRIAELASMDPEELLTTVMNVHQKAKEDAKMTDCSDEYFAEAKLIASRVDKIDVPGFESRRRDIFLYQHPDGQYIKVTNTNGQIWRKIISEKLAGWAKKGLTMVE